ncbi:IDEAL domain-containing protein [Tepidibacillus decaturensis]|uniref:IDEAL domain-containing protein n=2 Tax=Bacillaceae TaxID=186817 RepID=A0A135L3L9_9BACI|nr:IDEAL domain-containing protein [Tepidibacillus decaturensis]KXG43624.1 hypothetical protein U473_06045 [Tepidibacillus decaturensis]
MERQNLVKDSLLDLMAEMVLDKAVRQFNKEQLYAAIDVALIKGDKETFIELTNQLKQLLNEEEK